MNRITSFKIRLSGLKKKYSKESPDRDTVLEQEKRTLESEKFELEFRLEIATNQLQNVTQAKRRLECDLEDCSWL